MKHIGSSDSSARLWACMLALIAATGFVLAEDQAIEPVRLPAGFAHFDVNRDGRIDADEHKELQRLLHLYRKEYMALVDKDGNGRVSREEKEAARAARCTEKFSPEVKALIRLLDANGDGELSLSETTLNRAIAREQAKARREAEAARAAQAAAAESGARVQR